MSRSIVITGSTRGIGLGLSTEFLQRGHNVCISGQSQASVDKALGILGPIARTHGGALTGAPCRVDDREQIQALWQTASEAFGQVDIWINNAGISNRKLPFAEARFEDIEQVIATNVMGLMTCCRIALAEMTAQGSGRIYNFEGFGSDGRTAPGLAIYGASKSAVTYFTKALIRETRGSSVQVGYLSPGLVITHLLLKDRKTMDPDAWAKSKRTLDILADRVETVTPWLVEQILSDTEHGSRIAWLTKGKVIRRLLAGVFGKRRDPFTDQDMD